MICKHCGKENVTGSRFCVSCGADLTRHQDEQRKGPQRGEWTEWQGEHKATPGDHQRDYTGNYGDNQRKNIDQQGEYHGNYGKYGDEQQAENITGLLVVSQAYEGFSSGMNKMTKSSYSLKMISLLCGGFYLVRAVMVFFSLLSHLLSISSWFIINPVITLLGSVLTFVPCLICAFTLFLFALEGVEQENALKGSLYQITVIAAVIRILAEVTRIIIFSSTSYLSFFLSPTYLLKQLLIVILIAAAIEGTMLAILIKSGSRPIFRGFHNLTSVFWHTSKDMINRLYDNVANIFNKTGR
ncbi:MAG: zinc ribbon domain-containing protein [Clostridiales bacterium]|nr:zinc ribbon domain-containing protein [Clostridiales bacterium]